jgi:UDP-glucose 4-epimerase
MQNYNAHSRIVVTGARGRISQAILPALRSEFHEVIAVSRTSGSDYISYEDAIDGDIFTSASVIVHGGWSTVPILSESHPGIEWRQDLPLLSVLLESISKLSSKAPRFIFLSSAGTVYGPAINNPSKETDQPAPIGWYGRAKVAAESLMFDFASSRKLDCLSLRISNPYGIGNYYNRPQGIISAVLRAAKKNEAVKIWGDGSALKDYIHIEDLIEGMIRVIKGNDTGILNLCSGESHSVLDIISTIEVETGTRVPLEFSPAPNWDVRYSRVCSNLFRQKNGWKPSITLTQGIRKCLESNL